MRKSVIAGNLISRNEVETLVKEYPHFSAKQIGDMLGVSRDVIYQFYHNRRKKKCNQEYNSVTSDQITLALRNEPNLTLREIAELLGSSVSQIERTMRGNHIKIGHKGRKIPFSESELEDRVEYYVKHTGMQRQEIAAELGVTAPTVGNYVKRLKKLGRVENNFSFRLKA